MRGDLNLKPENITTAEAQLTYTQKNATVSTTVYHSESSDLIGRERIDGTTFFSNFSSMRNDEFLIKQGTLKVKRKLFSLSVCLIGKK